MVNVHKIILSGAMGYSLYLVLSCPCEQIGMCKRETFLALASIPFGYALYNYVNTESCPLA